VASGRSVAERRHAAAVGTGVRSAARRQEEVVVDTVSEDIAALERKVARDAGDPAFAVLAEAYRRAGRLDDARRVAVAGLALRPDDAAGRLALGLSLLDLGEAAAARYELERAMGAVAGGGLAALPPRDGADTFAAGTTLAGVAAGPGSPPTSGGAAAAALGDAEIDAAFDDAEPIADEMLDANRIAEEAIEVSRLDDPEAVDALGPPPDPREDFPPVASPTYATLSMARLLEAQGDGSRAEAIRERLGGAPQGQGIVVSDSGADDGERARIVSTLERWLANIQRVPA